MSYYYYTIVNIVELSNTVLMNINLIYKLGYASWVCTKPLQGSRIC